MNSKSLTIALVVMITLALLWTNGRLQYILNQAFGA